MLKDWSEDEKTVPSRDGRITPRARISGVNYISPKPNRREARQGSPRIRPFPKQLLLSTEYQVRSKRSLLDGRRLKGLPKRLPIIPG